MQEAPKFSLRFIQQENHLMLPEVTSILLTQQLYDILFQYVITPEKEKQLEDFIKILEQYIKSKPSGPFSLPVSELEFLEEGLQELKLLNWREIPVSLFEIVLEQALDGENAYAEQLESVFDLLKTLTVCNPGKTVGQVYVYPSSLTGF